MGMTERDRKVLAIVIAVVVLGGFWFLVVGKKRSAIKDAQATLVSAQADLETAKTQENAAVKTAKVKPVAYSRLLRLGKAIPVDEDFQSLLVQVNDLTLIKGVTFKSLSQTTGSVPDVGSTGDTTCSASGSTSAPSAATGATAAPSPPTGPTGSTAQTWVGKDRDKAKNAVADSDKANAQTDAATKALECANAPTLTDIAAKAAGLQATAYSLVFISDFKSLEDAYGALLDMVTVHNAHVGVTGRLLDINSLTMTVQKFPFLSANVQMTGYRLPVDAASNGTELNATATTPTASGAASTGTDAAATPAQ